MLRSPNGLDWYIGAKVHAKSKEDAFRIAKNKTAKVTHPNYPNGQTSDNSGFAVCDYGKHVFAFTGLIG
jgi:hypothetical protein